MMDLSTDDLREFLNCLENVKCQNPLDKVIYGSLYFRFPAFDNIVYGLGIDSGSICGF